MDSGVKKVLRALGGTHPFVKHFKRAIDLEMDAMRVRQGPFEVTLERWETLLEEGEIEGGEEVVSWKVITPNEKLAEGLECTLRTDDGETLVKIVRMVPGSVLLECAGKMPDVQRATLVIYPWFLYEKLSASLSRLFDEDYYTDQALKVFGKKPAARTPLDNHNEYRELNSSQKEALRLCAESDLSFVWGPPGTGKTMTLAYILEDLATRGQRVLLLSTTNAALDHALSRLVLRPKMKKAIDRGEIIRIGKSEDDTFGAGVREATERLEDEQRKKLEGMIELKKRLENSIVHARRIFKELNDEEDRQWSLFESNKGNGPELKLEGLFRPEQVKKLNDIPRSELQDMVVEKEAGLKTCLSAMKKSIQEAREKLHRREKGLVSSAKIVFSTLTNGYFSPLMEGERFDAVVVEEASMAILPALFYAASLGKSKTVIVGDPRQLPAIVQADDDYVQKVMGRNIFEVAIPDALKSSFVAMLETQYRMEPKIGDLVSKLFYAGRLKHKPDPNEIAKIKAMKPFPGESLVVVDTGGQAACERSARSYSRTNEKTALEALRLAREATESGAESVAVITPYADQARKIRDLLKKEDLLDKPVECSTVHRFQGRECDIVILDTVDAEPLNPGGLLHDRHANSNARNLVNVAVSRARGKLILIADLAYFQRRAPAGILTMVLNDAVKTGFYRPF